MDVEYNFELGKGIGGKFPKWNIFKRLWRQNRTASLLKESYRWVNEQRLAGLDLPDEIKQSVEAQREEWSEVAKPEYVNWFIHRKLL